MRSLPDASLVSQMSPKRKALLASIEIAKRRSLSDLYYFDKYVLGYNLMVPHVHKKLCLFTQKEMKRGENEQSTKLILEPRNTFKSRCVTIGYTLWRLARNPNLTVLITNGKLEKSKEFLAEIKGHITSNARFKLLFGEWSCENKPGKRWSADRIDIAVRSTWGSTPSVQASSAESAEAGGHFDLIIADDLHNEENTTTKERIDGVIEYYQHLGPVLKPGAEEIVIGTRWDYKDVYSYILQLQEELGELSNIDVLIERAVREDGTLLFPEFLSKEFLARQRAKLGSYMYNCNPAGTPILMSDWGEKNIEDVRVGDEVVGWSDTVGPKQPRQLCKSSVVFKGCREADVVRIKLESGREIVCTPDHKWFRNLTGRGPKAKLYLPAQVGKPLEFITRQPKQEKDAWLAGIFDGEGSSCMQTIRIGQSKEHNPEVCEEIERRLIKHGFEFGSNADTYWINGPISERARFLNLTRPIRSSFILRTLWKKHFCSEHDKVISIEPAGKTIVYSMQTSTGNYIAWGYGSSNCQYINEPVEKENALVKRVDKYGDKIGGKPAVEFFRGCNHFITVDLAYTEDKRSDSTAIICNAVNPSDGKWYIRRYDVLKTGDPDRIIDLLFEYNKAFSPLRYGIEKNNYTSWLKKPLEDRMRKCGVWLPIDPPDGVPHYGPGKNKALRLRSLAPRFNYGETKISSDMAAIEDELLKLTYDGARGHDDLLDALAMQEEIVVWGSQRVSNTGDNENKEARRTQVDEEYTGIYEDANDNAWVAA